MCASLERVWPPLRAIDDDDTDNRTGRVSVHWVRPGRPRRRRVCAVSVHAFQDEASVRHTTGIDRDHNGDRAARSARCHARLSGVCDEARRCHRHARGVGGWDAPEMRPAHIMATRRGGGRGRDLSAPGEVCQEDPLARGQDARSQAPEDECRHLKKGGSFLR